MTHHLSSRRYRLAAAAVCTSGACVLAACGGSGGNASSSSGAKPGHVGHSFAGKTLTVFDGAPTGANAKNTQAYYNDLSKAFHQATGAKLQWSYYSSPSQEVSKIETSTVSGSGPDVISYGTSFVGTLWATHDFPKLSSQDWAALGGRNSIIHADLYDSGVSPSKDIGIPNETNPFVLAYNKAYFKKAHISSPPKTWTQLVQDGQAIQKAVPGVAGVGMDPGDPYDPWKNVYFLTRQLGGQDFVAKNGKSTTIDSSYVQKAVQFYFSLEYKYHVVPHAALTWNSGEMDSAFLNGKVGMILLAAYGLPVSGTKLQGNLGYALLPTVPYGMSKLPSGGVPIETETTGNYWAIPGYTGSLRPLALEFEKISISNAIQLKQFKLLGWMPVTYKAAKSVQSLDPSVKPFILAEERAIPTSTVPAWSYVETGIETALNNIGSNLARTGSWSSSYANSQLSTAQSAADAHLK